MSPAARFGKHDVSGGVLRGRVTARPRTSRMPNRCLKAAASCPQLNQRGWDSCRFHIRCATISTSLVNRLVASERPTTRIYSRVVSQFISRSDAAGVGQAERPTAQVNGCEQSRRHPARDPYGCKSSGRRRFQRPGKHVAERLGRQAAKPLDVAGHDVERTRREARLDADDGC